MDFVDLRSQYQALRRDIDARVAAVLEHGQYIMGPEVTELESKLAEFAGAGHCITVASGTEALLIALMALDIGPGSEVITTPFTFVATVEVIVLAGATPVFVDVERDTGNMDVGQLEAAITERTRAIMPVSLYGQPCDMDPINAIAARHRDIVVIEDAAQSFGATYRPRRSCNLSTIGCTSFFPSKPLGCYGDGGAIFTSDEAIGQACREIRVHGQSGRYHHTRVGVGGRMDTLQCAVLLAKLTRFPWELQRRRELAALYEQRIRERAIRTQFLNVRSDRDSVWAQFTLLFEERDGVQQRMRQSNVPTAVHYPKSLHQQPAYERFFTGLSFPASEYLADRVLSLPFSADLSPVAVEQVADALLDAAGSF
jgi:UDP-2-acetamido-2-deoxy-ribo-hexuluronate aminotransferase